MFGRFLFYFFELETWEATLSELIALSSWKEIDVSTTVCTRDNTASVPIRNFFFFINIFKLFFNHI